MEICTICRLPVKPQRVAWVLRPGGYELEPYCGECAAEWQELMRARNRRQADSS